MHNEFKGPTQMFHHSVHHASQGPRPRQHQQHHNLDITTPRPFWPSSKAAHGILPLPTQHLLTHLCKRHLRQQIHHHLRSTTLINLRMFLISSGPLPHQNHCNFHMIRHQFFLVPPWLIITAFLFMMQLKAPLGRLALVRMPAS